MGLLYIKKQLTRCFKIRVGIYLNSYQIYHNAGCHSTSFTSSYTSSPLWLIFVKKSAVKVLICQVGTLPVLAKLNTPLAHSMLHSSLPSFYTAVIVTVIIIFIVTGIVIPVTIRYRYRYLYRFRYRAFVIARYRAKSWPLL